MLPTLPTLATSDGGVSGGGGAAAPATVRKWNDDDSEIRVPVVAASDATGDFTVLALINPDGTKAADETVMAGWTSGGSLAWVLGTLAAGGPFFYTAAEGATVVPTAGGVLTPGSYWLLAYCKQGLNTARVFRICELGGTPQHINGDLAGGVLSPASTAGGYLGFGRTSGSDDLDALMPVAAIRTSFLTEADFNTIASAAASALLVSGGFGGVWNFNQAVNTDNVPDLAGNHATITGTISGAADLNGITGTTIVSGSAPAWTFA